MKRLALLAVAFATPALASVGLNPSPAYKECTALAASNPGAALAKADEWLKIDQGMAAQHCRAMALYGLRRYTEAAQSLVDVRNALGNDSLSLRIYVTHQVARAWISAGQADAALADYSGQLNYLTGIKGNNALTAHLSAELLLERARLNITYGKLSDAAADLDHAVSLTPLDADVLLERAGVFQQIGDTALARLDAQSVLKLRPGDVKAQAILNNPQAAATEQTLPPIPSAEVAAPVTAVNSVTQPQATFVTPAAPAPEPKAAAKKVAKK